MNHQLQLQVYRSVLLTGRRRHTSGGSDGSKNGASRSSSPTNNTGTTGKNKFRWLIDYCDYYYYSVETVSSFGLQSSKENYESTVN